MDPPKISNVIKAVPFILRNTGRYCDGRFDPNHPDFESFCGLSHTRITALPLAIIMFLYTIETAVMFAILHIQNLAFANIIPILFTALLVIGVWKERPKLMRPFVVLAVIVFIFTIINVPLMVVALFVPDSWAFSFYGQHVMPDGVMDAQISILFVMLVYTMTCLITSFIGWSMHIHYFYILGNKELLAQQLEAVKNEKHAAKDHSSVECIPCKQAFPE